MDHNTYFKIIEPHPSHTIPELNYFTYIICGGENCCNRGGLHQDTFLCDTCKEENKCSCGQLFIENEIPSYQCKNQNNGRSDAYGDICFSPCDFNRYCRNCISFFMVNLGNSKSYLCKNCAANPKTRRENKKMNLLKLGNYNRIKRFFPLLPIDVAWIVYMYI
jgi:hypothetical protein